MHVYIHRVSMKDYGGSNVIVLPNIAAPKTDGRKIVTKILIDICSQKLSLNKNLRETNNDG